MGKFIGCDAHANARAADQDAAIHLFRAYLLGHDGGDVRIIDALATVGAGVDHFLVQPLEQLDDPLSDGKPAMVASDRNTHNSTSHLVPPRFRPAF
jgi:hypothetical protein